MVSLDLRFHNTMQGPSSAENTSRHINALGMGKRNIPVGGSL